MSRRERLVDGGSVASGPGTERMQPGAGRGGHPVAYGGLVCDSGRVAATIDAAAMDAAATAATACCGYCFGCFGCSAMAPARAGSASSRAS